MTTLLGFRSLLLLTVLLTTVHLRATLASLHHKHRRHEKRADSGGKTMQIRTKLGVLEGKVEMVQNKEVYAFLGVPFAEPAERFRPPQPAKPWKGVRQATTPAVSCVQSSDTTFADYKNFNGADMWNAHNEKREDCLYMNIWMPANAENATTMVWLFGGGFWYGSASLPIYNGAALAAYGNVIVVNPNYRLGAFGFLFLDHEEMPGNLGLLDQRMALRWIQEHIQEFHGDPDKVNLFGESAGAASIVAHMAAPDSWPLFRNGILQSGSLDNPWAMDTPDKAFNKSMQLVQHLNCTHTRVTDSVECLRGKSADELNEAIWAIKTGFLEFPLVIVSRDQAGFFGSDAYDALRNGHLRPNTDLMIGINQDEGTFWMVYDTLQFAFHPFKDGPSGKHKLIDESTFNRCVDKMFPTLPYVYHSGMHWEYNGKHPANREDSFHRHQLSQLIGDYYFTCDSLWLADELTNQNKSNVYVYHFEQRIGSNPWPEWMGVMHGYEIEYVFGLPLLQSRRRIRRQQQHDSNYSHDDVQFAETMVEIWSSFAKRGKPVLPSRNNAKPWRKYNTVTKPWYVLNDKAIGHELTMEKQSECRMWRSVRDLEYKMYKMSTAAWSRSSAKCSPFYDAVFVRDTCGASASFSSPLVRSLLTIGLLLVALIGRRR